MNAELANNAYSSAKAKANVGGREEGRGSNRIQILAIFIRKRWRIWPKSELNWTSNLLNIKIICRPIPKINYHVAKSITKSIISHNTNISIPLMLILIFRYTTTKKKTISKKDGIGGSYRLASLDRLASRQRILEQNGGYGSHSADKNGTHTDGNTNGNGSIAQSVRNVSTSVFE